ncbi:MAG: type VI secretion system tip protein TssI/VgrG [Byssovorax sp.]
MLSLWFASGEDSLSVRQFSVREGVSTLFEVDLVARSPNDDIDLESLLGRPAAFQIQRALAGRSGAPRTFSGICSGARQTRVEGSGLSTYELRLVPPLWLLTERRNHRIFQHASIPEIATRLLVEWGIESVWHIDKDAYPRLEYRVQHGESDFSFLSRLLEEAGIAYTFGAGRDRDEREQGSTVAFFDHLASTEPRAGGPIAYQDSPGGAAGPEYVTGVRISHELRPGTLTLRGFDFRRKLDAPLFAVATSPVPGGPSDVESRLEQHVYSPGSFFAEKAIAEGARRGERPAADDQGISRADEKIGKQQAERRLAAARGGRRGVELATNVLDLAPGVVFSIGGHGHGDLADNRQLLMTQLRLSGTHDGEWAIEGSAVFTDVPYQPAKTTLKPLVQGVESAVVVGPADEEIHTDEFGRVRVQFPWDREGEFDEGSSCWIRVSQGWAGAGYGMLALPRVGQEVVVGFFGGDPDQPVIVGRLFNTTSPVPQKLPDNRTATTWRSSTSPGGEGWNEITFEDAKGQERVFVQAERDLETLVKANESATVGGHRSVQIGATDAVAIALGQTIAVGGGRAVSVGGDHETTVGNRYAVNVGIPDAQSGARLPTGLEIVDRKITLSTGEATITLEGPNITLEAAASILLNAAASITINGRADIHLGAGANVYLKARDGDLVVQGGPNVLINPIAAAEDDPGALPMDPPPDLEMDDDVIEAEDGALFQPSEPGWLERQLAPGGRWDPLRWGPEHEDFGNFHLGVMAAAAGIPLGVMLRQNGKRAAIERGESGEHGNPGNGLFGGKAPYGNTPEHHALMVRGAKFHARCYQWSDHDA